MRRVVAALVVTVIGIWLVLSFKSSPVSRVTATPPTTTVPAASAQNAGQPPAGPPPPGPGTATTTTAQGASGTRTINGDAFSNRYGDVQVAVVLNGNTIVDVEALQLPFDRARSQEISTQAAPLLRDEVLQAQSAQIDTIGGATYTSDSYAQSLQSALDRARG